MSKNTFEEPALQEESITSLSKKLLSVTEQLTAANSQLQQAQQERADMLANLSHDLRAPVTAIRGAVDYLLSSQNHSPEDLSSALHLIDRRTQTLQNLIHDMYDLFCVESSQKPLELQLIAAAPFLEEYFFSSVLDSRYDPFDMQLDIPENLSCMIRIDVHKIIRVLDNLMTNAAKYSAPGSPIILKAAMPKDESRLCVSVIDRGIGIPPEGIDKVFSRTYTVSSARTPNSATGSGLGLSIAKAITEKHGGTLTCISQLNRGSTFTLELPACSGQSRV